MDGGNCIQATLKDPILTQVRRYVQQRIPPTQDRALLVGGVLAFAFLA